MESKTEPTRFDAAAVASLVDDVPKPTAEQMVGNKPLGYGTAGFRAPEYLLDSVCLRMGMLAALRSATLGVPVGIMVTASHNGIADNGLKLCDGDGGMLHHAWEAYAMQVEKAEGGAAVVAVLREIAAAEGMPHLFRALAPVTPRVVIGRDTRPHSPRLTNLCIRGAQAILGGVVEDLGIVTTPQLHHVVYRYAPRGSRGGWEQARAAAAAHVRVAEAGVGWSVLRGKCASTPTPPPLTSHITHTGSLTLDPSAIAAYL
jgi:phosphoacetylglucosamine mutase